MVFILIATIVSLTVYFLLCVSVCVCEWSILQVFAQYWAKKCSLPSFIYILLGQWEMEAAADWNVQTYMLI